MTLFKVVMQKTVPTLKADPTRHRRVLLVMAKDEKDVRSKVNGSGLTVGPIVSIEPAHYIQLLLA